MVISFRDGIRLIGVVLICACAAFVCFLFLTYAAELHELADEIPEGPTQILYDAQVATSKVVVSVTGGCLVSTAIVVLFFYVGQYISAHAKELGVLKALGWTRGEISRGFAVFGLSAFLGGLAGCIAAFVWLPTFLDTMNADGLLPEIEAAARPELFLYLAVLPGVAFGIFAVLYAAHKLQAPALSLLKGLPASTRKQRPVRERSVSFLASVRQSVLRTSRSLAFFVFIGAFCFSSMLQMSTSMRDLSSEMMGAMMLVIGIVLAVTCLLLSVSSAVRRAMPAAAIMHASGYSSAECRNALLGGFRSAAYIGFAAGTVYQYVLLRSIIDLFFFDYPDMPEYTFDTPLMFLCLAIFIVLYEGGIVLASRRLTHVQMRELATE